jgi:hypothetical protein
MGGLYYYGTESLQRDRRPGVGGCQSMVNAIRDGLEAGGKTGYIACALCKWAYSLLCCLIVVSAITDWNMRSVVTLGVVLAEYAVREYARYVLRFSALP